MGSPFSGWYWFATEDAGKQDSVFDGRTIEDDQIWFGYVQGQYEEWGYVSQGELESLKPRDVGYPLPVIIKTASTTDGIGS